MATTQVAPICARTLYDDELIDEMSAVKDTNKINARCILESELIARFTRDAFCAKAAPTAKRTKNCNVSTGLNQKLFVGPDVKRRLNSDTIADAISVSNQFLATHTAMMGKKIEIRASWTRLHITTSRLCHCLLLVIAR